MNFEAKLSSRLFRAWLEFFFNRFIERQAPTYYRKPDFEDADCLSALALNWLIGKLCTFRFKLPKRRTIFYIDID